MSRYLVDPGYLDAVNAGLSGGLALGRAAHQRSLLDQRQREEDAIRNFLLSEWDALNPAPRVELPPGPDGTPVGSIADPAHAARRAMAASLPPAALAREVDFGRQIASEKRKADLLRQKAEQEDLMFELGIRDLPEAQQQTARRYRALSRGGLPSAGIGRILGNAGGADPATTLAEFRALRERLGPALDPEMAELAEFQIATNGNLTDTFLGRIMRRRDLSDRQRLDIAQFNLKQAERELIAAERAVAKAGDLFGEVDEGAAAELERARRRYQAAANIVREVKVSQLPPGVEPPPQPSVTLEPGDPDYSPAHADLGLVQTRLADGTLVARLPDGQASWGTPPSEPGTVSTTAGPPAAAGPVSEEAMAAAIERAIGILRRSGQPVDRAAAVALAKRLLAGEQP